MIRIPVGSSDYVRRRTGVIANQHIISEYSVSVDREIINDRTNARYLIEDNIRNGVYFDLKIGLESFIDKSLIMHNEPCLSHLFEWAIAQKGDTIKKVFGDADIASYRGTLVRIAKSPISRDRWTLAVQKIDGVVFISEQSKSYDRNDQFKYDTYSGFKFEQYMTSDKPNGRPYTVSPIDTRPTFEIMVRSALVVGEESLKLCCAAEVDALSRDKPIEIKTSQGGFLKRFPKQIHTILQSEIVGVNRIVIGSKNEDFVVRQVIETSVDDMKEERKDIGDTVEECYSFLFTVLSKIKNFLVDNDGCRVTFDPSRKVVEIKGISRHEAEVEFGKKDGQFITEKLQKHFNIRTR